MDSFRALEGNAGALSCVALILGICTWAVYDYRDWVSCGTGGTPPTFSGWLRASRVRVLVAFKYLCGDDLRDPSILPRSGPQYLMPLEPRQGGHSLLKPRTLPQRQYLEPIEPVAREVLFDLMRQFYYKYPDILILGLSKAEGGDADAIYARPESRTCNHEAKKVRYEIAHAHPSDNSLHMLLSPADARTVIEASWGCRFPATSTVPPGWIMVYAPRDLEEVKLIQYVVAAAVQWVTGSQLPNAPHHAVS